MQQKTHASGDRDDLTEILDRALDRLPEKYRLPVILFHLEGRSLEEVSALLDIKNATVRTRLSRAREMLRKQLTRHSLAVSTGAVAGVLAASSPVAAMPANFLSTTTQAAACFAAGKAAVGGAVTAKAIALAEGGIRTMWYAQLKSLAAHAAVAGGLLAGGGWLVLSMAWTLAQLSAQADPPAESVERPREPADPQPRPLPDVLARVEAAWKQRQEDTKRLRLAWETETLLAANSVGYGPDTAPAEDTVIHEICTLAFADAQFAFSHAGPKWVDEVKDLAPRLQLVVSNAERSVGFLGGDDGPNQAFHAVGSFGPPGPMKHQAKHIQMLPLMAFFKPLDAENGLGWDLQSFRLSNAETEEPGVLVIEGGLEIGQLTLWLDEERDYVPTRIEYGGQLLTSCEIDYSVSDDGAPVTWVPQKWETILYEDTVRPRILSQWIQGKLLECEFQPELPPDEFTFELPAGTVVADVRTGEYYVLRADGTKRHITPEEQVPDVSHADLIATESGKAVSAEYRAAWDLVRRLGLPAEQVDVLSGILQYYRATGNARATAHLAQVAAYKLDKSGNSDAAVELLQRVAGDLDARHSEQLLDFAEHGLTGGNEVRPDAQP